MAEPTVAEIVALLRGQGEVQDRQAEELYAGYPGLLKREKLRNREWYEAALAVERMAAEVRRQALEEAAAVCERLELASGGRGADGDDCAHAIRALLDQPAAPDRAERGEEPDAG